MENHLSLYMSFKPYILSHKILHVTAGDIWLTQNVVTIYASPLTLMPLIDLDMCFWTIGGNWRTW